MAGTAGVPTSLVEMTISCRSLRDTDVFSKSDPVCIIMHRPFGANKWAEYKRTECISNTLNPDFATKIMITYNFEVQQHLKFCVYDIDSKNPNLDNHDFLGEFETTLGQLVSSRVLERPLTDKNCSYISCGNIRIITEELSSCREELILQLNGREFENKKWFGSISPFLEFSKANEDGTFTLVHRTEQARKTSTPVWKEFSVPLRSFCSGDYDRNLKVNAKDFVSSGNHKLFGTFHTTVRKLSEGENNTYHVINEEKQASIF
ncbi:Copine-8 [Armadillidium nasatum]|uniref:Copine-8 n=1 Tax=Armadillidium nasatum TaxID=96803 RepID=A0A5N5TC51_9CRUS|nr:Copine-8 [Armadillidium nasatum]